MAIKMRTNKEQSVSCNCCGNNRSKSIEMFDIRFCNDYGNAIVVTLCDACNEKLFNKTLKAVCKVNSKIKSSKDMKVKRYRKVYENRHE